MNQKLIKLNLGCTMLFSLLCLVSSTSAQIKAKKNIVLIMADDFNYWNGTTKYHTDIFTPNLDKLALRGVLFADAQAAAPVCNPSRQAMWSGLRPSTTGIQGNTGGYIRSVEGFKDVVTMNEYFYDNGYYTWGVGKLYHSKFGETGKTNDDDNWSGFSTSAIGGSRGTKVEGKTYQNINHPEYKWSVVQGSAKKENCNDTNVASETADKISGHAADPINKDKPFFLACGLSKPHLGWDAPEDFYLKYSNENFKDTDLEGFNPNDFDDVPGAGPDAAYTELLGLGKLPEVRHMYAACLTLADYNAGIIINAVENSIYKDNTIIVFMGDHGWILGEKPKLGKASQWDMANKTTLVIYDPSYKNSSITTTRICTKVVSLQDIYPTLVELSGLPIKTDIEGNSLAALIENPLKADWDKPVAVTRQFDRIRTNKWSYCDYDGDGGGTPTDSDMLYDIEKDPYEHDNMLHSSYTGMPKADVLKIRTRLVAQLDSIKNVGRDLRTKITAPYTFSSGKTLSIPGTIEAEDYDEGGYAQTHFDNDRPNAGNKYRTADAMDIYTTDDPNSNYHIGNLSAGDWCNYTVKDYLSGGYKISFRAKNPTGTSAVLQIFNRDKLLTEVTIPAQTTNWTNINSAVIALTDQYSTRLQVKVKTGTGLQLNKMEFTSKNLSNPEITANISRKVLVNTVITDSVLQLDLESTDVFTTIAIYNINGKLIEKNTVPGEQKVTYTTKKKLNPGIYLLRVEDDNVSSVEKFIVK